MFRSDYLRLHFLVFLWGFTAILGLLISLPALTLVIYRTFLASVGLLMVIIATKGRLVLPPKDVWKMALTGGLLALHWITFFGSARLANASVSLVGVATASLWTALFEPAINKRRIKIYEVLLGLVVLTGLYIIYSFDFHYGLGLLISISSGALSAVFFVVNSQFGRRIDPRIITFYEMSGAFIFSLLCLFIFNVFGAIKIPLQMPGWMDLFYLLILSMICTVYAYTAAIRLMKRLSAFTMQLTINMEPVYGIILALLIFGDREKMSVGFYVGAALILGAVVSYPMIKRRVSPDPLYELPSQ